MSTQRRKLKVKVKKLHRSAVVPKYAKDGDAGLDLTAVWHVSQGDGIDFQEYGTGLAFEIPKGFVGLLFPRSSITNKQMMLKNSVGVIDSGYRGEVKLRFIGKKDYEVGDRVGQLIIVPYPEIELEEVEELEESERGVGGHGSTGN